ncbi:MAG: pyrimidine reductase family protein [Microbacteriaceae bacterium]|nr:pyrimidine reductase family protein [Microbacteriaceae bacterium]
MGDSAPVIAALRPAGDGPLDREALLELYGRPGAARGAGPWTRVNFVSTADGSATGPDGRSGGISTPADKMVFGVLRRLADVVLVAAGTVRDEQYHGPLVSAGQRAWRAANGLAEHPGFVIASRRLDLDPAADVFTDAPVRPLIATVAAAPAAARAALSEVADVVDCGEEQLDPVLLREAIGERGWLDVLCEGGPSFFGALASAGVVDELCLTVSARLVAGDGPRIAHGAPADLELQLAHVLRSDAGDLLLRYTR